MTDTERLMTWIRNYEIVRFTCREAAIDVFHDQAEPAEVAHQACDQLVTDAVLVQLPRRRGENRPATRYLVNVRVHRG